MKVRITFFVLLSFLIGFYSCSFKSKKEKFAKELLEKVENFRKVNNRIPENVRELGLSEEMDSPVFYHKENDSVYIIWYGLSIGESNVYNSSIKEWKKEG